MALWFHNAQRKPICPTYRIQLHFGNPLPYNALMKPPILRMDELPPGYARIISALERRSGLTREEIAQQAYVAATTLSGGGYLRHMKELGLIHISGWRRSAAGSFSIPQYSAGRGKDYVRPSMSPELREAPGMQRLLDAIERHGPVDYRQAARLAGLAINTVKNAGYLKSLIAQGLIYVADWRRARNGPPRPLFEAGDGRSVPRPRPLTAAQKSRRHRAHDSAVKGAHSLADQVKLANRD